MILAGHYVWATFAGTKKGVDVTAMDGTWGKTVSGIDNLLKYGVDQKGRRIETALTKFDHLPGVIGWKIAEEPKGYLTDVVARGYEIFKSFNPRHIVSIQHDKTYLFPCFKHACDVVEVDVYALRGDKYPIRYAASVLEVSDRIKKALKSFDTKAVWFVGQVQPPSYWKPYDGDEELSLKDYRTQIYAAVTAGAKGVVYYHWSMLRKAKKRKPNGGGEYFNVSDEIFRERIATIKQTVAEMRKIGPIIAEGRVNDGVYVRWCSPGKNGPGPQLTRVVEHDGNQYLFIVNLLDVPVEAYVFGANFDSNPNAYRGKVFQGDGDLKVSTTAKGELKIKVAARGAGVFELTRKSIIRRSK
jgi:hypothetical protein